jgi:hypothetical protein
MTSTDPIHSLNRVLSLLRKSFPQYLRWGRPYTPPGREHLMQTIEDVALAQDGLADRVSLLVDESGGLPDDGEFPMEFTDTHDLAIDFLIDEAIGYQKQDIAELAQLADDLKSAPAAKSLASEALGLAKGHLELLEKLGAKPGASTIVRNGAPALDNN